MLKAIWFVGIWVHADHLDGDTSKVCSILFRRVFVMSLKKILLVTDGAHSDAISEGARVHGDIGSPSDRPSRPSDPQFSDGSHVDDPGHDTIY